MLSFSAVVLLSCVFTSVCRLCLFFFFKQKTAYEMRISDWSSDVCSSDLRAAGGLGREEIEQLRARADVGAVQLGVAAAAAAHGDEAEIGRASCRERVCQYV